MESRDPAVLRCPVDFSSATATRKWPGLPKLEEIIGCEADIPNDLTEKIRRDVATGVKRNRGNAPIRMTKLVGTALTNLGEAEGLEDGDDLPRLSAPGGETPQGTAIV
jgi:hypothetical protein